SLYTLKLDYNISPNDSLSVSMAPQFASNSTPNQALVTANFPVLSTTSHSKNGNVSIHHRRLFSPTFVNELMVGYAWTSGPVTFTEGFKALDRNTYGFVAGSLNPANNPYNVMPAMTFGGVVGASSLAYDGRFPYNGARNVYNISDNVAKTLGAHTLKAGIFIE